MQRAIGFTEEHDLFRDSFRAFADKEMAPRFADWERAGVVDRDLSPRPAPTASWPWAPPRISAVAACATSATT